MLLGIEIGGTKLQFGLGVGDGHLAGLWRGVVDPARGADGILVQIENAVPQMLSQSKIERSSLRGVGVGFGGPVDDATRTVIKSHQIAGWDGFPLADWIGACLGLPAVLGNDADVAGLAEALFGAGRDVSPVFYVTIGSGIGGGLVLDGRIHRGTGRGASEIGHLRIAHDGGFATLESVASGWGIEQQAAKRGFVGDGKPTVPRVAEAAARGDEVARKVLDDALDTLAEAICHVIALVCPRRVVVGGGVSLLGEAAFFEPLRAKVAARVFAPFANCYEIIPAALGETVVVHGALALARQSLGG
jgi:glucokinase